MRLVLVVFLAIAVALPAGAQTEWQWIYVTGDMAGSNCNINGSGGYTWAYVLHRIDSGGASGARFSLPIPDCMNGATVFYEESHLYSITGDSQSGITVDYGQCVTPHADINILTVCLFLYNSADECCFYVPLAHPQFGSRKAEFIDCNGQPHQIEVGAASANPTARCLCDGCERLTPEVLNPIPGDHETGVPINTLLTWDSYDPENVPTYHTLFFGANPNPPEIPGYVTDYTWDPGYLEPVTTYYWSVGVWTHCGASLVEGPIWQFTTGSDVPVEATTWGRIKSLYHAPE